ncbi:MAG: hypothetical protein JW994_02210 [Candidatus Omnitrophica bacterium]|nr:hypothetical protein [Candidatus Omnitrophota bacterium]
MKAEDPAATFHLMLVSVFTFFSVFLCGCGSGEKPAEPGVIETMSGKSQFDTYKKLKSSIEEINKTKEEQYNEMEQR